MAPYRPAADAWGGTEELLEPEEVGARYSRGGPISISIEGRLVDAGHGSPVKPDRVEGLVLEMSCTSSAGRSETRVVADAGRFHGRLAVPSEGASVLAIRPLRKERPAADVLPASREIRARDGKSYGVDLVMAPSVAVSGRVVDTDGVEVGGAWVRASPGPLVRADESGSFRLRGALWGSALSLVYGRDPAHPGACRAVRVGLSRAQRLARRLDGVELVTETSSSMALLTIEDRAGDPVPGARVAGPGGEEGRADDLGQIEVFEPVRDSMTLLVRAEGYVSQRVELASGTDTLTVSLEAWRTIRGTVSDPRGRPRPGVRVVARIRPGRTTPFATTRSDGAGRFELRAHAPNSESILTASAEGSLSTSVVLPRGFPSGHELRLVLEPAGRLTGFVSPPPGVPTARVNLSASRSDVAPARIARATIEAPGEFALELPSQGEFELYVSAEGFKPHRRRCRSGEFVEIHLEPEAHVSGRVVDRSGAPCPRYWVRLLRRSGSRADPRALQPLGSGRVWFFGSPRFEISAEGLEAGAAGALQIGRDVAGERYREFAFVHRDGDLGTIVAGCGDP